MNNHFTAYSFKAHLLFSSSFLAHAHQSFQSSLNITLQTSPPWNSGLGEDPLKFPLTVCDNSLYTPHQMKAFWLLVICFSLFLVSFNACVYH